MSPYLHVANVAREVHDALMRWARRLLQEAGLETTEVYGQFPPQGTVTSHLVLFPYRVGPEPKMVENSPGASLLGTRPQGSDRVSLVPRPWAELGAAMAACLDLHFNIPPVVGAQRASTGDPLPYPRLSRLPEPLQRWYADAGRGSPNPWVLDPTLDETDAAPPTRRTAKGKPGEGTREPLRFGIPPALTWQPGIVVTARYIAVVGEPGRGTSERTSVSAPVSLSALSVLTAGLHRDNLLTVRLDPLPCQPELLTYGAALAQASRLAPEGGERAERLERALEAVQRPDALPVPLHPIHDLTNHEFALLMQALQKPLQAALNLQLRLHLAAQPIFGPSAAIHVHASQTPERR